MDYLSSRKVVHGDLACRNILLARNNVVKISDFGLAKYVEYKEYYKNEKQGPLPIKWLSIETLDEDRKKEVLEVMLSKKRHYMKPPL